MIDFIFQMGRKAVNFDLGYFGNAEGIYLRQFVRIDDLCHRHHLSFFAGVGPIDSIMGYNDGFLIRLLVDKRLFLFLVITSDLCYFFTGEKQLFERYLTVGGLLDFKGKFAPWSCATLAQVIDIGYFSA